MEILIPGLILVALMVFLSTKIKKSAAKAFEEEQVETDEFRLTKPAGFLWPLDDEKDGLVWSARSKELGEGINSKIRRATAEIRRRPERNMDQAAKIIASGMDEVKEGPDIAADRKSISFNGFESVGDVRFASFHKVISGPKGVLDLNVRALYDHADNFMGGMEELRESFSSR